MVMRVEKLPLNISLEESLDIILEVSDDGGCLMMIDSHGSLQWLSKYVEGSIISVGLYIISTLQAPNYKPETSLNILHTHGI